MGERIPNKKRRPAADGAGAISLYENCRLCPRRCGVNRLEGERGFCGETAVLRLASASIHRGEEPPVTGNGGSGTIFVTGCNLGCAFCQNRQISREGMGRAVSSREFAAIALALEARGAENINIVTGSHAIPAIARGLDVAVEAGLAIPALWNSSAYECPQALDLLEGRVGMWLPDLKTLDPALSSRFFAEDYPRTAQMAIRKMLSSGSNQVIIRHLMLPGFTESTKEVLRWFSQNALGKASLSLMTQYTPVPPRHSGDAIPQGFISEAEYFRALEWLDHFGIDDGFCQEPGVDSSWLPDFTRTNPFSSALSIPVWHWKQGFVEWRQAS